MSTLPPLESDQARALLTKLLAALNAVVQGKAAVIEDALAALLARGHLLLEDVPGVGKTTLARALALALGCSFKRIQFTSDLMPSDILGVSVYSRATERFEFQAGPIFAHLVLADEINRSSPKTQSSLLEAMNEGQVSVDHQTYPLPSPFAVIATQNPHDHHGTFPLPEGQLDRFMLRLRLGYPEGDVERAILAKRGAQPPIERVTPQTDREGLLRLQATVDQVQVDPAIIEYLLSIVHATRKSPAFSLGVSPRGALALLQVSKARALIEGRSFVLPDDVKRLAVSALAHRIRVAGVEGLAGQAEAERLMAQLVAKAPVPR